MIRFLILSPLMLILSGCGSQPETSSSNTPPQTAKVEATPQAVKLTASQELAKYCRVCVLDKGERMEEFLPSRLDVKHNGQTYKFCSEPCKKSFEANRAKYAVKPS